MLSGRKFYLIFNCSWVDKHIIDTKIEFLETVLIIHSVALWLHYVHVVRVFCSSSIRHAVLWYVYSNMMVHDLF